MHLITSSIPMIVFVALTAATVSLEIRSYLAWEEEMMFTVL